MPLIVIFYSPMKFKELRIDFFKNLKLTYHFWQLKPLWIKSIFIKIDPRIPSHRWLLCLLWLQSIVFTKEGSFKVAHLSVSTVSFYQRSTCIPYFCIYRLALTLFLTGEGGRGEQNPLLLTYFPIELQKIQRHFGKVI